MPLFAEKMPGGQKAAAGGSWQGKDLAGTRTNRARARLQTRMGADGVSGAAGKNVGDRHGCKKKFANQPAGCYLAGVN